MSSLLDELEKLHMDDLLPHNSLEKMSDQDQADLALFLGHVAKGIALVSPLLVVLGEKNLEVTMKTMILVYGFIMGHNWVKDHWTLW